MSKITGIARIKVNGELLESMPGAELDLGGYERTESVGHRVYGYTEKVMPSVLTCTFPWKAGAPIEDKTLVRELMHVGVISASPESSMHEAALLMLRSGIHAVVVVEEDEAIGILTQTDLTRFQATSSAALIQEIARRMGLEAEIVTTAWDGIIGGLLTERYDAIVGSMSITDVRDLAALHVAALFHGEARGRTGRLERSVESWLDPFAPLCDTPWPVSRARCRHAYISLTDWPTSCVCTTSPHRCFRRVKRTACTS